jgi:hypothetical protein
MIFDSEQDKKLIAHIVASFHLDGPYAKVGPAVHELDALKTRIERGSIAIKAPPKILKEVK